MLFLASTGVLLIKAPLLSMVVRQRIRVCSELPNQADLLLLRGLLETGKLTPTVLDCTDVGLDPHADARREYRRYLLLLLISMKTR